MSKKACPFVYYKNWKKDKELWENFIIPELDKKLKLVYSYGK